MEGISILYRDILHDFIVSFLSLLPYFITYIYLLMNKLIFLFFSFLCGTIGLCGQTINYALKNENGAGYVEVSPIEELDNSSEATFQMWINPVVITGNASLISQDNFSLNFNENGQLSVTVGSQIAVLNYTFPLAQWSQISLTIANGVARAYINNEEQVVLDGRLPELLPVATANSCLIGKGFNGSLDEIRVWRKALSQTELYWRNTLNKFNPNYEFLVAYWKGDQDQCENLVDYKFAHHGILHNVVREPVTDNENFRYCISTGYTNFIRFIDRPNIDRDMFLMTNDLILLSGKIQKDGSIAMEYADNTATPTNVNYIEEFEGRKGVMDFQGDGSQMISKEGAFLYSADTKFGREEPGTATLQGWFYIDSWKEGALLFSQRKDADNCIEIKLGAEATKDIIVDLCGTKATLSEKLEVGKWQYIAVYFAPKVVSISNIRLSFNILSISIDYQRYNALNGVTLSGNDMNIASVPLMQDVPIVMGKDFDGKMDEVQAWATDRSGSVESDSKNPYLLNVGSWNNLFLTAYWKGDDPDNIGKDSQSYTGMIEFMRNYYAGYRGMKIRLGLIYPDGDKWSGVLNQKENVDRLIADAKALLPEFDGIDVDLEWHYYNILNPVIRRLIDEVMKGQDDKIFSVSQHYYSYTLDKSLLTDPGIDYFTMQIYGPQTNTYTWDYYESAYNAFINYGYPKEKLVLSYGVLLVDGTEAGYKDLFEKFGMNDDNYDPDLNIWNGKYFNGVNQVKRKQNFILDRGCLGTMYFDMGNDLRVSDYKSLIRAQNEIIASNVDTLITQVKMDPGTGVKDVKSRYANLCTINQTADGMDVVVVLADGISNAVCNIYNNNGTLCFSKELNRKESSLYWGNLSKGIYLISVSDGEMSESVKLYK